MKFLDTPITLPSYRAPSAWLEHGPFAGWLVRHMRPRRIVELGTHYGFSYFAMCEAVSEARLETRCFAIDTWLGDEHAGQYDEGVYALVAEHNHRYRSFSTLVRTTFAEAASEFEDHSIDLLHIDGRHFYEDVKEDFETWRPKLAPSAVVLFHDIAIRDRGFGVYRFWSEISAGQSALEFTHGAGLGVLFWGDTPPSGLERLVELAAHEDTSHFVTDQFETAGAAMREYDRLRTKEDEAGALLREKDNHIIAVEAELDRYRFESERVAKIIRDKENRIIAVEAELDRYRLAGERLAEEANTLLRSRWWRGTKSLRITSNRLRRIYKRPPTSWPEHFRFDPSHPNAQTDHTTSEPGPIEAPDGWVPSFMDPQKTLRVLYVSCDISNPSHVYRVENMIRGLTTHGVICEVVHQSQLRQVRCRIAEFDVVVVWRVALAERFDWCADLRAILGSCRNLGIAAFFDVDDLVFDPELCTAKYIDGLRYLSSEELELYDVGVRGYRAAMLACGNAIVPTEALRARVEAHGVQGFVVPNGLDQRYEEALIAPARERAEGRVLIGYTPGTRTHQKDFAVAADALARLLAERDDVELRILGPLDISEFPALAAMIGDKVRLDGRVGRDVVFEFNRTININIAPLEHDNPFTEAKSELKYFEPAVFGVPTVASRVGPFATAIENGFNGFTAVTVGDWYDALSALVADAIQRHAIGMAARKDVCAHYKAKTLADTLMRAFHAVRGDMRGTMSVVSRGRPGADGNALTINWLVDGLLIGSGGHRMIFRAAHYLWLFGHNIRIYFLNTEHSPDELRKLLHRYFLPIQCEVYLYNGVIKEADVLFATYWKTVDVALRHRDVCANIFYFVQDFEPYFFPMGSDYILCENTYRQGMYAITAGPWCAHFLRNDYGAEADSFTFPIEDVYKPALQPRTGHGYRIVFFAKPEMPRRCFEIGVAVLKEIYLRRPSIELVMFGSDRLKQEDLAFPARLVGVRSTAELADLYRSSDVGIAFAPTNPSAVPYEMMACGLPVVDLDRPYAESNYGGTRGAVLLADARPDRMAQQILALLDDPEERGARARKGLELVESFPTEEGMARQIESLIIDRVAAVRSRAQELSDRHSETVLKAKPDTSSTV